MKMRNPTAGAHKKVGGERGTRPGPIFDEREAGKGSDQRIEQKKR